MPEPRKASQDTTCDLWPQCSARDPEPCLGCVKGTHETTWEDINRKWTGEEEKCQL